MSTRAFFFVSCFVAGASVIVAGCGSIERVAGGCVDVDTGIGCGVGADGAPTISQCLGGQVYDEPTPCSAFCLREEPACTPIVDDFSPVAAAVACGCSVCEFDEDCAVVELCTGVCTLLPPGNWSILGIAVDVPALTASGLPWDPDSAPDLVVDIAVDEVPWISTPVAPDGTSASWTFDGAERRFLTGTERFDVTVFDADDADLRVVIEDVFFTRLSRMLADGGYQGTLLEVDRPTTLDLRLQREDGP